MSRWSENREYFILAIALAACLAMFFVSLCSSCAHSADWQVGLTGAEGTVEYGEGGDVRAVLTADVRIGPVLTVPTLGFESTADGIVFDSCVSADVSSALDYWVCSSCDLSMMVCEVCFGMGKLKDCVVVDLVADE